MIMKPHRKYSTQRQASAWRIPPYRRTPGTFIPYCTCLYSLSISWVHLLHARCIREMVDTHHFARTHVGSSPGTEAGPVADSPCSTLSQALRPRARVDSLGDLQMGKVDFGWPNVYLIFELSSCLLFDQLCAFSFFNRIDDHSRAATRKYFLLLVALVLSLFTSVSISQLNLDFWT